MMQTLRGSHVVASSLVGMLALTSCSSQEQASDPPIDIAVDSGAPGSDVASEPATDAQAEPDALPDVVHEDAAPVGCDQSSSYLVGAGISDITGPPAELGMMGYAMFEQTTAGIHTRLWSRAFVLESPCNHRRAAFVSADLLAVFQGVRQQVVERLRAQYGDLYSDANVYLSATHTHSGPGAFSHYTLYNIMSYGYSPQNFEAIVSGIVQSIVSAHNNLADASMGVGDGDLLDTSINRSPDAYALNPQAERAQYPYDTDKRMILLRIDGSDGTPVGLINWFGVHATSMGNQNHLISGDNKGLASMLFERMVPAVFTAKSFVAAFAQGSEGDSSPNIYGGTDGGGSDDFESTELSAGKQFSKARELYDGPLESVVGPVDFRFKHVKMDEVVVAPEFADGTERKTCVAAIGMSMIAGAEDGPGYGKEGYTCDDLAAFLPGLACIPVTTECQAEKPIVVEMGSKKPVPWTPEVLPFHLLRLGSLALVGLPFETTTMSSRRIRRQIEPILAPLGITRVQISGPANAFAGYMTTRQEYALQHYEGASTHFGPWQLAAVTQIIDELARAMRDGTEVDPGPTPRDLRDSQSVIVPGILYDDVPLANEYGEVVTQPAVSYQRGETASAVFWSAHPNNDLHTNGTYLRVERQEGGSWTPVALDRDWETRFSWERNHCVPTNGCSHVTVQWLIPNDAPAGTYRLVYTGERKSGLDGSILSFTGTTQPFEVL